MEFRQHRVALKVRTDGRSGRRKKPQPDRAPFGFRGADRRAKCAKKMPVSSSMLPGFRRAQTAVANIKSNSLPSPILKQKQGRFQPQRIPVFEVRDRIGSRDSPGKSALHIQSFAPPPLFSPVSPYHNNNNNNNNVPQTGVSSCRSVNSSFSFFLI